MKANQIRAELILRDITGLDIAKKLGISKQAVSAVVNGRTRSRVVRQAIAEAINKPVSEVFPEQEPA